MHLRDWLSGLKDRRYLLGALLLGLLLRLAYMTEAWVELGNLARHPDMVYHDAWARTLVLPDGGRLADGRSFMDQNAPYFRPPGYPMFLAAIYGVFGTGLVPVLGVQCVLGLLGVWLVWRTALRWFDPRTAGVAALMMAASWPFILHETKWLDTVLLVPLALFAVDATARWAGAGRRAGSLVAGLALGLFAICRPNALAFALPAVLWMLWQLRADRRRGAVCAALYLLGMVLAIAPVTLRNSLVSGEFVPVSANAGINFYFGFNEESDGVQAAGPEVLYWNCSDYPKIVRGLEEKLGHSLTYRQADAYFAGRAFDFIRQQPGKAAALVRHKIALFWGAAEIEDGPERTQSRVLRYLPFSFPLLLGLAVAGALAVLSSAGRLPGGTGSGPSAHDSHAADTEVGPPNDPVCAGDARAWLGLVFLFIASYAVSYLPFIITARYRVPLLPFLIIPAAVCVVRFFERTPGRRTSDVVGSLGVIIFVAVLSTVASGPGNAGQDDRALIDRAAALSKVRQHEQALACLRRVPATSPVAWMAEFRQGVEYAGLTNGAEAALHYERALQLNPGFADAWTQLGALHALSGRHEKAIEFFARAHELTPGDAMVETCLGTSLLRLKRIDEGRSHLESALQLDPSMPDAHSELGLLELAAGEKERARRHFEAALAVFPSDPVARAGLQRCGP